MKLLQKTLGLILAFALVICSAAYADVDFDPSDYTEEELREIQALVRDALSPYSDFTGDEVVLYDEGGITVYTTGWEYDAEYCELTIDLILINESGKAASMTVEEVYLNDWATYMGGWIEAKDGRKAQDYAYCYTDEDADVTSADQLEVLEFVLEFCDPETYDIIAVSEPIVLRF